MESRELSRGPNANFLKLFGYLKNEKTEFYSRRAKPFSRLFSNIQRKKTIIKTR